MPELRRDPVMGRWVIISAERAKRPDDFKKVSRPPEKRGSECPFCEGNERMTPNEILASRPKGRANGPGWEARVVPNKFPALMVEGELGKRADGMYDLMNGIGAHEVIIESPRHSISLTELTDAQVRETCHLYKQRLKDLAKDPRLAYGLVFKNVGEQAGASLEHTHSQLIATPIVPLRVQREIVTCRQYFEYRDRCLICDLIVQERSSGARVVLETNHFIALAPFAARFPFETHLMPKDHQSHFEHVDDALLGELAVALRETLVRIERAVRRPPYNYLIHTSPLDSGKLDHYHWHFEIIPRITRVAGFEWGSGFYINPMPPEHAARYLREVKL